MRVELTPPAAVYAPGGTGAGKSGEGRDPGPAAYAEDVGEQEHA
jgi:hypothetical protein